MERGNTCNTVGGDNSFKAITVLKRVATDAHNAFGNDHALENVAITKSLVGDSRNGFFVMLARDNHHCGHIGYVLSRDAVRAVGKLGEHEIFIGCRLELAAICADTALVVMLAFKRILFFKERVHKQVDGVVLIYVAVLIVVDVGRDGVVGFKEGMHKKVDSIVLIDVAVAVDVARCGACRYRKHKRHRYRKQYDGGFFE